MGYLHAGHVSLVQRARKAVGTNGKVVVSIYVNPTQFAPNEDFSRYPRDFKRDSILCREAGADLIFAPLDKEMYPRADRDKFSTFVVEDYLSKGMEGSSRPTHFRGVTTVVAKLFNVVLPDVAVFGAKDYQQAAIMLKMVRDLNFPLKVIVAPTLREKDGLAMSSRNKYLEGSLRQQATSLWRAMNRVREEINHAGKPTSSANLKRKVKQWIEAEPDARLDYVEFFDPDNLTPRRKVSSGTQMALAAFVGKTRLIDNCRL